METGNPHYTVLARRFRPQTFSEVVGQSHVAQALKNAIAAGRVAHAYLFTGARGVGKTSMARIFAKALNCPNAVDGVPCNACDICEGIASGHDVDVLEIDGASNRRIDDIRMLRSNVGVKSMRTKYKIYIIDEVHMLTNEAFNALLKTLEEPPPNVKFVFCTTEPNKVPETILSRCQRFDFSAIDTQKIVERLHEIAVADGYAVEPAVLEIVARRAAGSMRDSQSLFDQLLAYGGKSITVQDVHRLLGTASDERLIELAAVLVARQPERALDLFDRALGEGVQLSELFDQLVDYCRDLMVIGAGAQSTPLQSVAPGNRAALADQARRWGLPTIVAGLQILAETKTRMQRSGSGRALAELALVRLSLLESVIDLADLIDELRENPAGSTSTPATVPSHSRRTPGVSDSKGPSATNRPAEAKVSVPPPHPKTVGRVGPAEGDRPVLIAATKTQSSGSNSGSIADSAQVSTAAGGIPTESRIQLEAGREPEILLQIVSEIGVKDILRDNLSAASRLAILGPNLLEISFPPGYHFGKEMCEQPNSLARLEKVAGDLLGRPVRITFRVEEGEAEPRPRQPAATANGGASMGTAAGGTNGSDGGTGSNDPYVEKARSIFGAAVVRVESLPTANRAPAAGQEDEIGNV